MDRLLWADAAVIPAGAGGVHHGLTLPALGQACVVMAVVVMAVVVMAVVVSRA